MGRQQAAASSRRASHAQRRSTTFNGGKSGIFARLTGTPMSNPGTSAQEKRQLLLGNSMHSGVRGKKAAFGGMDVRFPAIPETPGPGKYTKPHMMNHDRQPQTIYPSGRYL